MLLALPEISTGSYPQFDSVVRSMRQILLCTQVPLGRLDRGMAKQQLDLLQLPARGPAQLRACATAVMWRDAGHSGGLCIRSENLPETYPYSGRNFRLTDVAGKNHRVISRAIGAS
jgi:hypothetical protein